jgi:hypothetical protein
MTMAHETASRPLPLESRQSPQALERAAGTIPARRPVLAAAAAVLALGLAGCSHLQVSQADMVVQGADPAAAVTLTIQPAQVRVGEDLAMQIRAARPGHLYVVQLGSAGRRMSLMFPNAIDGGNRLATPDSLTRLPGAGWRMVANGPPGTNYYVAIVSDERQDLEALRAALSQGRIDIWGRYGAAIATLREL